MLKHKLFATINDEKIVAYAMAHIDDKVEFHEEQLRTNDQKTIKIVRYAMSYLEDRITFHEDFINNFKGDKKGLAQCNMVARYKQELKELSVLIEELIQLNKLEKSKVIESFRALIDELSGKTSEELHLNYNLKELKKAAGAFKIKGRTNMDKINLCLKIEEYLNDVSEFEDENSK